MNAYAATENASKRRGLFRELYVSLLMQAAIDATVQGVVLSAAVGECTWTSEQTWNAVGQGRVYIETAPNGLVEVPYIQPPVDWNACTGFAEEGAGDVPEHLMLEVFVDPLSGDQLISIIDAIYRWNNKPQEEYFISKDTYLVHKVHVDGLQAVLNEFIRSGHSLHLLSAIDRSLRGSVGVSIKEHTASDRTD